jgi:hypothetical protein
MSRRPTMPGAGDPKDSGSPHPGFGSIDDAPRSGEVSVLLKRTVVWQEIFFQIEVFFRGVSDKGVTTHA